MSKLFHELSKEISSDRAREAEEEARRKDRLRAAEEARVYEIMQVSAKIRMEAERFINDWQQIPGAMEIKFSGLCVTKGNRGSYIEANWGHRRLYFSDMKLVHFTVEPNGFLDLREFYYSGKFFGRERTYLCIETDRYEGESGAGLPTSSWITETLVHTHDEREFMKRLLIVSGLA